MEAPKVTPFDLPPVVMEPVTASELLADLRGRINKGYMPSSTSSCLYNGKPHYIERLPEFIESGRLDEFGTGFFAEMGTSSTDPYRPVYLFIDCVDVEILCNLRTDELKVRIAKQGEPWYVWDERPVAINRFHLIRTLEDSI